MRYLLSALALVACSGDTVTNIYGPPAAGAGGAAASSANATTSGEGGASTGSTAASGGVGGESASNGGTAGEGGGSCVPQTCADVFGSCGNVDNGCGTPIDCTSTCDTPLLCGSDGTCTCMDVSSDNDAKNICTHVDAMAWCGAACVARRCGAPSQASQVPMDCKYIQNIPGTSYDVWCCKS